MKERPPFRLDPGLAQSHLRILQTTDLHAHLLPYDYFADRPAPHMGLARTGSLIERLRGAFPNCLLFDNGDFLQGNPLSDWIAHQSGFASGDLHPVIAAMNALGYDGGTLGNHEFNYGLPFLEAVLERAAFPVVCANIRIRDRAASGPGPLRAIVPPAALLDRSLTMADGSRREIRIGIAGFAPPQIEDWERVHLEGRVEAEDIVQAARREVPRLRAAGADIVIALSHSGIGPERHRRGMENAAVPLAAVPGIDAVLAGHTHQVFPGQDLPRGPAVDPDAGTLHGKPAVMAGFFGRHVGVIDLLLEHGPGGWSLRAHAARVEPVATPRRDGSLRNRVGIDRRVLAEARRTHAIVLDLIRRPVGRSAAPLQSHFALVAPDATLQVVADAQRAQAQAALEGTQWAHLPLLSAAAPYKAGGLGGAGNYVDIPAGDLLLRHAAELYLYPNSLCVVQVTGADLQDWLERAAGSFARLHPGRRRQPLLDPAFPSYNFDVIDGLLYAIDPSRPARYLSEGGPPEPQAGRVRDLRRADGTPVRPTDRFLVVTNSFRAGGGGNFAGARRGRIVHISSSGTRDAVLAHIRATGVLQPEARPTWRFAPLPGTSAQFDSGPGAPHHLASVTERRIRHDGPAPSGFERFTIDL